MAFGTICCQTAGEEFRMIQEYSIDTNFSPKGLYYRRLFVEDKIKNCNKRSTL